MNDIDRIVSEELNRGDRDLLPAPLTSDIRRRIKRRRRGKAFLSGVVGVGIVTAGIAVAPRSPDGDRGIVPAAGAESVYVVDSRNLAKESKILRFAASGASTAFSAGYDPQVVLSPDGSVVYVASVVEEDGDLVDSISAFAADSGDLLYRAPLQQVDEPQQRSHSTGFRCCTSLVSSADGRWLFFLQVTPGDESERTHFIGTFDTADRQMLPESIPLSGCAPGAPVLLPLADPMHIAVACEPAHAITVFTLSPTGAAASSETIDLPGGSDSRTDHNGNPLHLDRLAWAVTSGDRAHVFAVTLGGRLLDVDTTTGSVNDLGQLGIPDDHYVAYGKVIVDDRELYLGLGQIDDANLTVAESIAKVDLDLLDQVDVASTGPFWNFGVFSHGRYVVTVNANTQSLRLFDGDSLEELKKFEDVGVAPQQVVVPLGQ